MCLRPLVSLVPRRPSLRLCSSHSSHAAPVLRDLPVLAREVSAALKPQDGHVFLDMTFGSGGHTRTLLGSRADIKVIAMDRDPVAYEKAVALARETDFRVLPLLARFSEAPDLLRQIGVRPGQLNGVILDVGASVDQLQDASRGFNASLEGPLDMRMDGTRFPGMATAADVINTLDTDALTKVLRSYGESKKARKIAQAIVDARFMMLSIKTTSQLVQLVTSIVSSVDWGDRSPQPTTVCDNVFRALRLFVNNELNELNYAIEKMREFLVLDPKILKVPKVDKEFLEDISSGVLAVLCTNPMEDRIVKDHVMLRSHEDPDDPYTSKSVNYLESPTEKEMQRLMDRKWLPLEKFVLFPSEEEILTNPTGKATRLRCAMRRL